MPPFFCCSAPLVRFVELRFLGRTRERSRRRLSTLDHLRDLVEVAGADFLLVADERVAVFRCGEFRFLQLDVRGHLPLNVSLRQLEHVEPHRVDAGERDELELVAHRRELLLELRDRLVVEIRLPVERR